MEPKATVYMYMPDAVGLVSGAPVRVNGIDVGKVDSVVLTASNDPNRVVIVSMFIERDRLPSIPADSTAQASADTVIGDKFVDITSGTSRARLRPGSTITYKATTDLMKRLDLSQFEESLKSIDAVLSDIEGGKSPVGQFVMTDTMYKDVLRRVAQLQAGLHAAADTRSAIGQALYTDTLWRKFDDPLRDLDQRLSIIQSGQGSLGQLLRDNAQYDQLRSSIGDLRRTVASLSGSPMLMSEAAYNGWVQGVQSLIQQVDNFASNPMMTSAATYENLNGMARELASGLKDFRENPKKYLRLKVF
jgi:phospholipid/cholesterol/gamma-HCH transport system substrate-binding protein